ncbi:MAG: hypothetical protein R3B13_07500 [Polyangiaceae bacterium]
MATAALALAGCGDPGEVQIQSFGGTIWSSPLGADYLTRPQNLGISSHEAPPETLTARVDSERTRPELLFFPFDPQITFDVIQDQQNSPLLPTLLSPGFVHPGGLRNYFVGAALYYGNGGVTPRSIQGLYQRIHGECELEVKWESLFKAIAGKLDDYSGEVCNDLFCPDFDISYDERVLTSYLRQVNVTALGGTGRGGFGLFIKGDAEFDSPAVGDVRFSGNAAYDLVNIGGLPAFRISKGPYAQSWDCSSSPFVACPNGDVKDGVKDGLRAAEGQLDSAVGECATAPVTEIPPCEYDINCSQNFVTAGIALSARTEALARGFGLPRAQQYESALLTESNWTCAPVTERCAALTGADATGDKVCQVKLRAADIVPMPNSFSLVWYRGDGPQSGNVTAAAALYLALQNAGNTDGLAELCSPLRNTYSRKFTRFVDNSSH